MQQRQTELRQNNNNRPIHLAPFLVACASILEALRYRPLALLTAALSSALSPACRYSNHGSSVLSIGAFCLPRADDAAADTTLPAAVPTEAPVATELPPDELSNDVPWPCTLMSSSASTLATALVHELKYHTHIQLIQQYQNHK